MNNHLEVINWHINKVVNSYLAEKTIKIIMKMYEIKNRCECVDLIHAAQDKAE
jgi:hypothetical protein